MQNCTWTRAALDKRPINTDIFSPVTIHEIDEHDISRALQRCKEQRLRAPRTLSLSLAKPWIQFLQSILMITNLHKARLLLWLAPSLLAYSTHDIKSSSSFKAVRNHLELLQDRTYLAGCIHAIASIDTPPQRSSTAVSEAKRFHTMVKRGLFLKAIEQSTIRIAQPSEDVDAKLNQLYPTNALPDQLVPAHEGQDEYSTSFPDLAHALRKLKPGKSPGFSGWTKELLWPLFQCTSPRLQTRIVEVFSSMGNVESLTELERRLLQDGVLIPFEYLDRAGKIRPITLKETFGKLIWHTILDDVYTKDNRLSHSSGQCFFRPGGSSAAAHALSAALAQGPCVAHDSKNCFNSFDRAPGMAFVRERPKIYGKGFRWFNPQYADLSYAVRLQDNFSIEVTSGSNQGCVSSGFFHTAATWKAMAGMRNISIVDDAYTYGNGFIQHSIQMSDKLKAIGLDVTGPKTCLFVPDEFLPQVQSMHDNNEFPAYLYDEQGELKVKTGR